MKKGLTELVFILDKSGSMSGLECDTIGGYNSMLKKQQAVDGECRVTTVLFDHGYELLHDRIDLQAVSAMTEREYQVGGDLTELTLSETSNSNGGFGGGMMQPGGGMQMQPDMNQGEMPGENNGL